MMSIFGAIGTALSNLGEAVQTAHEQTSNNAKEELEEVKDKIEDNNGGAAVVDEIESGVEATIDFFGHIADGVSGKAPSSDDATKTPSNDGGEQAARDGVDESPPQRAIVATANPFLWINA